MKVIVPCTKCGEPATALNFDTKEPRCAPHMGDFIVMSHLLEDNGKTVRENNEQIEHKIPKGTLVEAVCLDGEFSKYCDCNECGMRLFVVAHHRDCDGTPLYSLGTRDGRFSMHGYSADSLQEVVPQPKLRNP